jgi:hypothetical protein
MLMWLGGSVGLWQFRRGRQEFFLRQYRNPNLPRVVRNLPIVGPVFIAIWVPMMVILGPAAFGVQVDIPFEPLYWLIRGASAYILLSFVILDVLLYRPPRRLFPRWLLEDDRRRHYEPPPPTLYDRMWLLFAVPILAVAIGVLVIGLR